MAAMYLRAGRGVIVLALLAAATIACHDSASTPNVISVTPTVSATEPAVTAETTAITASPLAAAPDQPPPKSRKVVVLDPGHGGDEIGASRNGLVEKDSNLDFALRVERILLDHGFDVVLTRRSDARAAPQIPGFTATRSDVQARLDLANAAQGDVFVSIHSNGSEDLSQRGVEAWYDSNRDFAAEGKALAGLLVAHVIRELSRYGYSALDRGLFDGVCYRSREGRCFTLFAIGGARATSREEVTRRGGDPEALGFNGGDVIFSRPANMPAALVELLIITNATDAAVLRQEAARDIISRGVATGIIEFLESTGS